MLFSDCVPPWDESQIVVCYDVKIEKTRIMVNVRLGWHVGPTFDQDPHFVFYQNDHKLNA